MQALQRGLKPTRALARHGVLAALVLVAACSKDKNVDQPAKLTPLPHPSVKVTHLWGHNMGDKKAAVLRLGQGISITDNRVYAAGHKGEVVALDLNNGHVLWHTKTGAPLSGGTASSPELVVVGASDGQLFALDPATGHIRWKIRLNGEVLAPAAISAKLVAVRTVDGKLHALSPEDGHELWATEQQVPRLSLRGTASPVINGDLVLCGFDNGKVLAVNAGDGSVQWEATVTPRTGAPSSSGSMTSIHRCGSWAGTCTPSASRGRWRCSRSTPGRCGGRTRTRATAA